MHDRIENDDDQLQEDDTEDSTDDFEKSPAPGNTPAPGEPPYDSGAITSSDDE